MTMQEKVSPKFSPVWFEWKAPRPVGLGATGDQAVLLGGFQWKDEGDKLFARKVGMGWSVGDANGDAIVIDPKAADTACTGKFESTMGREAEIPPDVRNLWNRLYPTMSSATDVVFIQYKNDIYGCSQQEGVTKCSGVSTAKLPAGGVFGNLPRWAKWGLIAAGVGVLGVTGYMILAKPASKALRRHAREAAKSSRHHASYANRLRKAAERRAREEAAEKRRHHRRRR